MSGASFPLPRRGPRLIDPSNPRERASFTITTALVAGAVSQGLFWRTGLGVNLLLWNALVIASVFALLRRDRLTAPAVWAACACVGLALSVARFASSWALAFGVPCDFVLLAVLPVLVARPLPLSALDRLPFELLCCVWRARGAASGVLELPRQALGDKGRAHVRPALAGTLAGIPVALTFATLLASDSRFRTLLARVFESWWDRIEFVFMAVSTGVAYLVAYGAYRPQENSAPLAPEQPAPPPETARSLSTTAWAFVVGQVTLVFAVFVAANLRPLFGGSSWVHASASETYAGYLHSGFGLLISATVLSVGLIAIGHVLLAGPAPRSARPVPGGRVIVSLEATLVVLNGVTAASCLQRLWVYEDAYGASRLRLAVAVLCFTVIGLLAITLAKVIWRGFRGYAGAVLALAVLAATAASQFNADAYVALANLDRAARGRALDHAYLQSLSADARPALEHPLVRADARLRDELVESYCAPRGGDWRSHRGPIAPCTVARPSGDRP